MKKTTQHSFEKMSQKVSVNAKAWNVPASESNLTRTVENLKLNGFAVHVVASPEEALEKIKTLIPQGSTVMNGSSTTLAEIGFVEYLKNQTTWKNGHAPILAEKNPEKQRTLRRESQTSEWFLSSCNAITKDGHILGCDASGSRVGAWLFAAKHLVLVAGTNKIVPDVETGMKRILEFAFPLEDARSQEVYGVHSGTNKWALLYRDFPGRTTVILVKEALGY